MIPNLLKVLGCFKFLKQILVINDFVNQRTNTYEDIITDKLKK